VQPFTAQVLITPMYCKNFEGETIQNTPGDFPESVRQTAKEENVALIDLTRMSVALYEAPGPEKSWLAFSGGRDATHHSAYGLRTGESHCRGDSR
jgi:hypothetical protein